MPASRRSAFATLAVGSLLLTGSCVNLTFPKELTGEGGQGGTGLDAASSDAPATGGTGGVDTGGAGGVATGGVGSVATGATGGVAMGGAGGATTGSGTGGVTTGGVATGGLTTGGVTTGGLTTGGVTTGGAGGKKTGGTTATGGSSSTGDAAVPPDLRPPNEVALPVEVAPPPDLAIDTPIVPDVVQIPDLIQVPDLPPDTPATTGLILYYNCEQATGATGTTLPDMSGNGNDGTLIGTVTFSPGRPENGNALFLIASNNTDAGTSGYVKMPSALLAGSTSVTIATWFRINSTLSFQRIFDIGTSDTTSSMYLTPRDVATPSNNLRFSIRTALPDGGLFKEDLQAAPVKTIPVNTWEHVAVVLDPSGDRLYLNGSLVGSATLTMRPRDLGETPNDWIGRSEFAVNPYLDGAIDEFRIYSRALSAAEISALYNYTGH